MKLEYINKSGATMELTKNAFFKLTNVDGLTGASASISTASVAGMDGDFVNNVRAVPRGIVLDLTIEKNVEAAKAYILRYVKHKQIGTLKMTVGDKIIKIDGVVENIEMPRFTNLAIMQITLFCAQPYWEDLRAIITQISEIIGKHHFSIALPVAGVPFGVIDTNRTRVLTNDGDVAVGLVISIVASAPVVNPTIYNNDTGDYIGVVTTMAANDEIIISTVKGQKTITKNGVNIISLLKAGSTWLQLETGENELTIDADEGDSNMYFAITYKRRFV